MRDQTDRARANVMTDAEIANSVAKGLHAAPLLTDELVPEAKVVWPVDIDATRHGLGPSQTEFTAWFDISPGTLRNKEQGRCVSEG